LPSLISVIVPVYNVAYYLPRCLDSLLNQTLPVEIILINDGSTDESGNICETYAQKYPQIKLIHQPNSGVSIARNTGLDHATGDYVGFADPDDWLDKTMFEKLLQTAQQNKVDIAVCGFQKHSDFLENELSHKQVVLDLPNKLDHTTALLNMLIPRRLECNIWNKLFSKNIVQNIRFDSNFKAGQDLAFVMDIFASNAKITVAYLAEPLYHYIMRDGSTMNSFSEKRFSELAAWEYATAKISAMPTTSPEILQLLQFRYVDTTVNLMRAASETNGNEYLPRIKAPIKPYIWQYLRSPLLGVRMKIRAAVIIFFPKASYRVWRLVKRTFKITWWYKEFERTKN